MINSMQGSVVIQNSLFVCESTAERLSLRSLKPLKKTSRWIRVRSITSKKWKNIIAERANDLLNGLAKKDPDATKWARMRVDAVP